MPDIITLPDGTEVGTGLLVPATFPTRARTYADVFAAEMLTPERIKTILAGKPSRFGRRQKFAGRKYVRNQGAVGACNGFSTAAGMSKHREVRGEPYVCLSGFDAYSQMNGGRDNGSALGEGMDRVFPVGIGPEELNPNGAYFTRQIPAACKAARARFKGCVAYPVDEEAELATALLLGRFVVVAVHATNAFNQMDSNGVCRGVNGPGNHSVLTQDIRLQDSGVLNYDMANSWDTTWCDGGHTWLTWGGQLQQTVRNHRFWVIADVAGDPADQSEPPTVE